MSPPFYYSELLTDEFGRNIALSPRERAVSMCIGFVASFGWVAWMVFGG